jgi:hypothetical protein
MPVLQESDIADLVKGTLKELGRLKFQQIAQNLPDYEVFPVWFKKDRVAFDSGIGIQRTLMNRLSGAARHVGLMDTDSTNISDVIDQLSIPWRHAQTTWGFIFQETLQNRGEALIFNVVKPRRADAMISLVEELESKAWAAPTSSTDKTNPYGIPYWIVKNATTGFNGSYPSGFTDVAGISLTTTPNFKNYTGQYVTVSKADLIKKLRTAKRKCNFKSPVDIEDYRGGKGERYRLYTTESVFSTFEDVGESQNENLGRDIASVNGFDLSFRGHPIRWVPALDTDTQNPVYGVDHSTFMPVCLKGDYLRESDAKPVPFQHNCYAIFVDLTYNYLCFDRRRNWVLNIA